MAIELFADNATTTLASSPSAGATSFTVASSSGFPAAVTGVSQFRVLIGTEIVTVTNVSGTTWTCSALAAGHSSGDAVSQVVTAAGLGNLPGLAPAGGSTGQVLAKTSSANYALGWTTAGGGAVLVASSVLAADAASVTFSSVPGTYSSLLLTGQMRSNRAAAIDVANLRFNGDAGSNYDDIGPSMIGNTNPTGGVDTAQTGILAGAFPGATVAAGVAMPFQVVIPAYAGTTFKKSCIIHSGFHDQALSTVRWTSQVGHWRSTSAITSVTLLAALGAFATGSSFYLYGMP